MYVQATLKGIARLRVTAGTAKPSPQIGQALGPLGVNMMEFCKQFNSRTEIFKESALLRVKLKVRGEMGARGLLVPNPLAPSLCSLPLVAAML